MNKIENAVALRNAVNKLLEIHKTSNAIKRNEDCAIVIKSPSIDMYVDTLPTSQEMMEIFKVSDVMVEIDSSLTGCTVDRVTILDTPQCSRCKRRDSFYVNVVNNQFTRDMVKYEKVYNVEMCTRCVEAIDSRWDVDWEEM